MWKIASLLTAIVAVTILSGCARSLPLISHAHVGHALTAWHDTPEQRGLFEVAEAETNAAIANYELARGVAAEPPVARVHVKNVIRSLNPDQEDGDGGDKTGYGAIRALQGAIDHLNFAASSDDTSDSLRQGIADFDAQAGATLDRLLLSLGAARLAVDSDDQTFGENLEALGSVLKQCVDGIDLDNDGVIGSRAGEAGLRQLRQNLSDLLRNEVDPPYHPIGRRYLIGLVKLPNGRWAYKFDRPRFGETSGGSSSSGGY